MTKTANASASEKTTQDKSEAKPDSKVELKPAKPAAHSDNDKSTPPTRSDDNRDGAPNDPPGSGESSEPPVG